MTERIHADSRPAQGGRGLAVWALICGITGVFCLPVGLVGLILGIIALSKDTPARGMAITGLVLGAVGFITSPILILFGIMAAGAAGVAVAGAGLQQAVLAANENAAAATLKSGLFPAQVLFQGGVCIDQDGDSVGEYGFLSELSGRRGTAQSPAGKIRYIQGELARGDTAHGYRFAVWLPDGRGGAIGEPEGDGPRPADPVAAAREQERWFVIYAWPEQPGVSGKRAFALTHHGQVREAPALPGAEGPEWNAVFGGKGWDSQPAWPVYDGSRRANGDE